ncbi:MAG: phenylalanine--tRNA ligase subunit alpha [Candidatus Omnitrophica bacterium]|nr:phenylalanine--tRNA ligase subunit alpha [Candidatus Omnitrophota bacterium]
MEEKIKSAQEQALSEISQAKTSDDIELLRVKYLGRKGLVNALFGELSSVPAQDKPKVGNLLNRLKIAVSSALDSAKGKTIDAGPAAAADSIDVTMPGRKRSLGRLHPLTQTLDNINEIFLNLGFKIAEGPEIETIYYNFEALNIPLDHPSRDAFDTFYIDDNSLLRSQTSTVQIRVMEKVKPPLAIISPGRVFRPDATDASHSFMFHQVEGLMVDKDIKFSDLKGILEIFVKRMFGEDTRMRFRPHFFPFTEPSAEVDISCIICKGKGETASAGGGKRCSVCGGKGWLEILGAGMVHPNVFSAVGYDPKKWRGFAFGMGVERIAMLKYGIDDIRLFFENDLRFLRQF